jgi:phage shock protein E
MQSIQEILKHPSLTLIDVRSPMEFSDEQLQKAINIPLDQVQSRIDEIMELPKPLVLFCRSGARSGMALSILKQAGMQDVFNGGGIYDLMPFIQQSSCLD